MLTLAPVNFTTYCCVSWVNTLTYVTVLYAKDRDRGRAGGGVHRPEFPFERSMSWEAQYGLTDRTVARLLGAAS